MEPIYIRTDKNGTKIFHDWECPRCGGAGFCDKWIATGRVCFACGGTGKRVRPKIVREYSPEYWAKLEARRIAKEQKRIAEAQKYAEEHADEIAEAHRKAMEFRYAEHGCDKNGIGYVLTGNTFPKKDEIKKAGGRWLYGRWICPVKITGDGIKAKQIEIAGHITAMGWKDDGFDFYEAIEG